MRSRKDIEVDGTRKDILMEEILLDIRDLLRKNKKKYTPKCVKEVK